MPTENENIEDEKNIVPKKRKTTQLSNDAPFHNFEEENIFEGRYTGKEVMDSTNEKTLGYLFINEEDSEIVIGNSFRITEAITKCESLGIKNPHLRIEFLGKMLKKKDGQSFNRFKIDLIED